MDIQQLQEDKLSIIQWIIQLQDDSVIERIKALMNTAEKPYSLTEEQQMTLNEQVGLDKTLYTAADKVYLDLKRKYDL